MVKKCIFCEVPPEEILVQNNFSYARFDRYPISPGHLEVIPKSHIESLLDLNQEELWALYQLLQLSVQAIESTDLVALYTSFLERPLNEKSAWFAQQMLGHIGIGKQPDGYNFGNNDGKAAGRTVHHLHIHVIPRYEGDVPDPRGGIRYIIPQLAKYWK